MGIENCSDTDTSPLLVVQVPRKKSIQEKEEFGDKKWWYYLGLTFALLAALSFSFNALITKVLLRRYSPFLISFVRSQGSLIANLVFGMYASYVQRKPILDPLREKGSLKTLLVIIGRGICGATVQLALPNAVAYIGIADALVVKSITPILVMVLASFCLGEPIVLVQIICAFQVVLGVLCIAKPSFMTGRTELNWNTAIGTALALTIALANSLGIIFMRFGRKLHFSIFPFTTGLIGSLLSGIACGVLGAFEMPKNGADAILFLAAATCTTITQISIVAALKCTGAGETAVVRSSEVFFGFLLQITFLEIFPDQLSSIGAAILVLAVAIAVSTKK